MKHIMMMVLIATMGTAAMARPPAGGKDGADFFRGPHILTTKDFWKKAYSKKNLTCVFTFGKKCK